MTPYLSLVSHFRVDYFLRKKEFSENKSSKKSSKNNKSVKREVKTEENDAKVEDDVEGVKDIADKSEATSSVIKHEGAVLKLKGLDDKTRFSDIKKLLQEYGKVAYVEDVQQNEVFSRLSPSHDLLFDCFPRV